MLGLWEQMLWIQARVIVWRGPAVDERNFGSVVWTWAGKSSWLGALRGDAGTRWGVGLLRDFYLSLQLPNYKNFKGTIQELGQNQYAVSGEIFVVDRNTVEITELPVRTWTQVGTRCQLPVRRAVALGSVFWFEWDSISVCPESVECLNIPACIFGTFMWIFKL